MRRSSRRIMASTLPAVLLLAITVALRLAAETNCRDCEPNFSGVISASGSYTIGFEPGKFTNEEKAAILNGARTYWNSVYSQHSISVTISAAEASYSAASIKFREDSTVSGTQIAEASPNGSGGGTVGVNPNKLHNARSSNFWKWAGSHEVGHLFGFYDVGNQTTGSCFGKTIMYQSLATEPGSLPGALCPDQAGVAAKHVGSGNYDPCMYGCPPGYTTVCIGDQQPDPSACDCCINYTPILIDLNGDGFDLSGVELGVLFQINDVRSVVQLGWPVSSDDVWLALDGNTNGTVDNGSELFGNTMRLFRGGFAQNGYDGLAAFDDDGDSWIDSSDQAYNHLLVWSDGNRNGISEPYELQSVQATGIVRVGTSYKESRRRDRWGNVFRYRGEVITLSGSRHSADVYPVSEASLIRR